MPYRLRLAASEDLIAIYGTGRRRFGQSQARSYHRSLEAVFDLLAENPLLGRERAELQGGVRIHPHKAHIVVYRVVDDGVEILRVRHSREDWIDDPAEGSGA